MALSSRTLGVEVIGSAASLKAALAEASAATESYAAKSRAAFASVSDSALKAQLAQVRLARETEKYGVGTVGAANAVMRYRKELDSMRASQVAAMQSVGRGLTTYVTAPTALLGYEAVKMGIEFQRQMLLIQTQAGATGQEVQNLTGQVLKLAPAVGIGPTALAQGLFHLESLGLRGSVAMHTLREAALAAGMGIANLQDVTSALGGAVVTGIRGVQNYDQAMGSLVAIAGAGNMRLQDLADALGTGLLPKAKNAGLSLNQVGAALATLTDRGIPAQKAATQLGTTFALMMAPSNAAQKALADMGIGANELGQMLSQPNGLLKVLETLKAGMERVGKQRGAADILASFGRSRQSGAILTLVESLDAAVSSYGLKLQQVNKDQRAYAANQKAYMESPSFKLHQDLAQIQTDMVKLGATLTPVAVKMADAVAGIAAAFSKLPGPVKADLGAIIGLLAVGGPLAFGIGGIIKLVGTMRSAFGLMAASAAVGATQVEGSMVAIEGSTAAAATEVASLRMALLGIAGIGAIAVPLYLDFLSKHQAFAGGVAQGVVQPKQGGPTYAIGRGGVAGMNYPGVVPSLPGVTSDVIKPSLHPTTGLPFPYSGNKPVGDAFKAAAQAYQASHPGAIGPSAVTTFALPQNIATDLAKAQAGYGNLPAAQAAAAKYTLDMIHSGRLSAKAQEQAWNELATLNNKAAAAAKKNAAAAKKAGAFAIPLALQLAQAHADATAALSPSLSGPTAQQLKIAREVKSAAMKAIDSHKLTMQGLIQAWGIVQQQNAILARTGIAGQANTYKKISAEAFTAGLGLTHTQRAAIEQSFAQAQAHGGFRPAGPAAEGIVIHVHGVTDPNAVANKVMEALQRKAKSAGGQVRGRHGGGRLAIG